MQNAPRLLLSLLILPEGLEPLELVLVDHGPLLGLLVGLFDLRELLHELHGLLLLLLELLSYVLPSATYARVRHMGTYVQLLPCLNYISYSKVPWGFGVLGKSKRT